jgi:hypothetical protein
MSELHGRRVFVAGRIPGHTRESLKALLAEDKARLAAKVSPKVDYLVVGEGASFAVLQEAYGRGLHAIDPLAFSAMLRPRAEYTLDDVVSLTMASLWGQSPVMTNMPEHWTVPLALAEERAGRHEHAEAILACGTDSTAALRLARMAQYCALDGRLARAGDLAARATQHLAVVHTPLRSRIHSALAVCADRLGQSVEPLLEEAHRHRHPDGRDDWPLVTALLLTRRAAEADAVIKAHGVNDRHGGPYDAQIALSDLSAAFPLSWLLDLKSRWVSCGVVDESLFISVLAARLVQESALDRLGEARFREPWYQLRFMHTVLLAAEAAGRVQADLLAVTRALWKELRFCADWLRLASLHAPALAHEELAAWDGQLQSYPMLAYTFGQVLQRLGLGLDRVQCSTPHQRVELLAGSGRQDEAHTLLVSVASPSVYSIRIEERSNWFLLALAGQAGPPTDAWAWVERAMERVKMEGPDSLGDLVHALADGGAVSAAYRVWLTCPYQKMRDQHEELLLLAACAERNFTVLYQVLARLNWVTRARRAPEVVVKLAGSSGSLWP